MASERAIVGVISEKQMITPVPLGHWVNDNNPPAHLQYGKGWWDYVETLRRLVGKFEITHADVVATYSMRTPPPEEELCMPVVRLRTATAELVVKYDFGTYPDAPLGSDALRHETLHHVVKAYLHDLQGTPDPDIVNLLF